MPNNDPGLRPMQQSLQRTMDQSTKAYLDKLKTQYSQANTTMERQRIEVEVMRFLNSQHVNQRELQTELAKFRSAAMVPNKRVAHPVWDLSNGDEGPAIVRKVPEVAERTKSVSTGWMNKNVAIYVGGQRVNARVAAVYRDGTYDLVTEFNETMNDVAESFIDFTG
jgi:hypothetical protein